MPESQGNFDFENLKPVHIGLLGHVDSGKTSIADVLTQIRSTAGLDAHPQSKNRGITIDIGFTFFRMDEYMVTLVDMPGHADLIRNVIAGANIIDMAIVVIDATQGIQIQTAEHIVLLQILEITNIIIALNKSDQVPIEKISDIKVEIKKKLSEIHAFENVPILPVSARLKTGFNEFKIALMQHIKKIGDRYNISDNFLFTFDHYFEKRGFGTVLTGTVHSGKISVGDEVFLIPTKKKAKIKSLQHWKKNVQNVSCGDRCGIALVGLSNVKLLRGYFLTNHPSEFFASNWVRGKIKLTPYYTSGLTFGMRVGMMNRMFPETGRIFPYRIFSKNDINLHEPTENLHFISNGEIVESNESEKEISAWIWIQNSIFLMKSDHILLYRVDLSHNEMRIIGIFTVDTFHDDSPEYIRYKIKNGTIRNPKYDNDSVIVDGWAFSKESAFDLKKFCADYPLGDVISPFGQKGAVIVKKSALSERKDELRENDLVSLRIPFKFKLDPEKSYSFLKKS